MSMNLTQALQITIGIGIDQIEADLHPEPQNLINALAAIVDANPATVTSMNRFGERLMSLQRLHAPVPPLQFKHWEIMRKTDDNWQVIGMRDTYEAAYRWAHAAFSDETRIVGVVG